MITSPRLSDTGTIRRESRDPDRNIPVCAAILVAFIQGSRNMVIPLSRVALAAALGASLATAAIAAESEATFESLDKDSDGRVSINEATEDDALFVAFEKLDRNRDGELTREEFQRQHDDEPDA